jgi:hypothetical protein
MWYCPGAAGRGGAHGRPGCRSQAGRQGRRRRAAGSPVQLGVGHVVVVPLEDVARPPAHDPVADALVDAVAAQARRHGAAVVVRRVGRGRAASSCPGSSRRPRRCAPSEWTTNRPGVWSSVSSTSPSAGWIGHEPQPAALADDADGLLLEPEHGAGRSRRRRRGRGSPRAASPCRRAGGRRSSPARRRCRRGSRAGLVRDDHRLPCRGPARSRGRASGCSAAVPRSTRSCTPPGSCFRWVSADSAASSFASVSKYSSSRKLASSG